MEQFRLKLLTGIRKSIKRVSEKVNLHLDETSTI